MVVAENSGRVTIDTRSWGVAEFESLDLEILAEMTGISMDACLARLRDYEMNEAAGIWNERAPKTEEEIRAYYAETEHYLWELMIWNHSAGYVGHRRRLASLAEGWPVRQNPAALDYGSGVGTAAIWLAEKGYQVTIADIPGRTMDFATARLRRRGIPFDMLHIENDTPILPHHRWDILSCFDVIEHLTQPAAVLRMLTEAVKPGGGAALSAAFDTLGDDFPHHLPEGRREFEDHRWEFFLDGLGWESQGDDIYRLSEGLPRFLHAARYRLWQRTGVYVHMIAR